MEDINNKNVGARKEVLREALIQLRYHNGKVSNNSEKSICEA
jgi:hypothetical protein